MTIDFEKMVKSSFLGYAYHKVISDEKGIPVDYEFIEVNPAFEKLTGIKRENIINKRISEVIPEIITDPFDWIGFYSKIALEKTEASFEQYTPRFKKWFLVEAFSFEKGFFVTMFSDITESKEKQQQSENFFDINLDLLCIANVNGRFVKLNKEWEKVLGYEMKELEGRNFLDFIHPDDRQKTLNALNKLVDKEDILSFTNRYLTKSGEEKIIEWRSHTHEDMIYAAARDVTAQHKTELELRTILETTLDGFLITDTEGNIIKVNTAFCKLVGYDKQELMNKNIKDFQSIDLELQTPLNIDGILKKGFDRTEAKYIRKDRTSIFVDISITVIKVTEPQVVVFVRDISEQKKTHSQFLSNMSHEIRTPLNSIIGFSDLLKNTPLNHKQSQFLENVRTGASNLMTIINDLLDLSKMQTGKLDLKFKYTNIGNLLEQSFEIIRNESIDKDIIPFLNIDKKTPKYMFTDPARLNQILNNLLNNALKFTENGEIELKLDFKQVTPKRGSYTFTIKDSGIGMDKKHQKKLFEAFYQADSSSTKKFGGSGLGLIISQRIANKMGSEIKFKSEKDKGSTFYFTLETDFKNEIEKSFENADIFPVQIRSTYNGPKTNRIKKGIHSSKEEPTSVLIVDDSPAGRFLIKMYLQELSDAVNVMEATNGIEAIELVKKSPLDIIITDLNMPQMGGIEATQIIRSIENTKTTHHTIIIALTATDSKEQEIHCKNMGMDDYLTKPIKKQFFLEQIAKFIEQSKQMKMETQSKKGKETLYTARDTTVFFKTLEELLISNDLSAIDFLNENADISDNFENKDIWLEIKEHIDNLNFKRALHSLSKVKNNYNTI